MKRILSLTLALLCMMSLFAACSGGTGTATTTATTAAATTTAATTTAATTAATTTTATTTQVTTTTVTTTAQPEEVPTYGRIVCASVAAAEIIVDLGLGDSLICVNNYAADIPGLPANVEYMDFLSPNPEGVLSFEPDLFIDFDYLIEEGSYDTVIEAKIDVLPVSVSSDSVEDVVNDIRRLALALGVPSRGEELVNAMQAEVDRLTAIGDSIPEDARKTVYFEIAPSPSVYCAGGDSFIGDMIKCVGAVNIFEDLSGFASPSEEEIIARNPDVILTNVTYVENAVEEIKSRTGYDQITAVVNDAVFTIDANATSRPTHNIVKAIQAIGEAVYPEQYANG